MSNKSIGLSDQLHQYMLSMSLQESLALSKLRETTLQHPMSCMLSAPEQGQFMALMVRLLKVKKIVEVGVFTGYSALWMAQALPVDGRIYACDISAEYTEIGKPFWHEAGVDHKIDLRIGDAKASLRQLLQEGMEGQIDLAFIDADKTGYLDYYEQLLKLLRPGGLIMVDNVFWDGAVANPAINDDDTQALRKFNQQVRDDSRVDLAMIPLADGLSLLRKK